MNLLRGRDAAVRRGGTTLREATRATRYADRQPEPSFIRTPSQMDRRLRRKIASGRKVLSGMAWEALRRKSARQGRLPSP